MTPTNSSNVKRLSPNVNFLGIELDNDDLLTEFLLWLPVKSLCRFKSVCKKWQSIISSDYFCHQHTLRRPKPQPSLILVANSRYFFYSNPTTNGEKKMIPYRNSFPDGRNGTIVLSCNGLSLLHFNGVKRYLSNEDCYYVHNLTTRRSRKISLNRNNEHPRLAGIGLAFDPSKSPYYKVVCVYPSNPNEGPSLYDDEWMTSYQIEVYDSESHSWKLALEAASVPELKWDGVMARRALAVTHWNNKIYWPSSNSYCYFDIDKNEMKTLSHPKTGWGVSHGLQVSNGHLYHCEDNSTKPVGVWKLVGNDETGHTSPWLLKHRSHVHDNKYNHILTFMAGSDGDETTRSFLTQRHGKISVYSPRDETREDLIDLTTQPWYQPKDGYITSVDCFQFGETLALV